MRDTGIGFSFGQGSGLGAIPFAIRSTDSQPAIFTSTAARDTYYTTNPGDLAGTPLGAGREAVGIGPTDGDPVGVTAAFIRNSANDAWIPIATNFVGATGQTGPEGPQGPAGTFLPREEITADLTISAANIATYRDKAVVKTAAATTPITVTLGTISSFLAATPGDEFIIEFVNESSTSMTIGATLPDRLAQLIGGVVLNAGESLRIALPASGTVWAVLSTTVNSGTANRPITPITIPDGNVVFRGAWDASAGTFPASAGQGDIYEITVAGTVDGQDFLVGDFIIAIAENPSTTTFAGNWQIIDGAESVHSWAGMQGIITDTEISSVLNRLGFIPRTDENIQGVVGGMVSGNTETGITVTYDAVNQKLNFVVGTPSGTTESFYHGLSSANDPSTVDLGTLGTEEVDTGSGQQYTFTLGPTTAGQYVILLVPADHDITALVNTDSGFSVLGTYTKTNNVRVINSQNYHSYTLGPTNAGLTLNYRATLA